MQKKTINAQDFYDIPTIMANCVGKCAKNDMKSYP